MDVYEAMRTRKSVRSFLEKPVEEETLERILQAARGAPSARNGQEWRFVVVRDKALRERIALDAARQPFIGTASVLLACCAESDFREMRCGQLAYPIDVAIAMDHITLAAAAEGLGTCWIGSFDERIVKDILGIPDAVRVVQLMPMGHPSDPSPVAKSRLSLEKIVMFEKWGRAGTV
jgi:nitroreductase